VGGDRAPNDRAAVSARRRRRPGAAQLVGDAAGAQGVPEQRRGDGDHGQPEPPLRLVRQADHREVGAHLHDRLDAGVGERAERRPDRRLVQGRDGERGGRRQPV
jgi:hypothetical protein